jgi:carbamoyltransferase
MNILGINPFHNGSVCVLSDGKIIYYLEEERLTKHKHDANPFRAILNVLDNYKIDEVVIGGINQNDVQLGYTKEDPFYALIRKFYYKPTINTLQLSQYHHLLHTYHTYYNSGFKEAIAVIIDAGGSYIPDQGIERESIYVCSPNKIKPLWKDYWDSKTTPIISLSTAVMYSHINSLLGFRASEEGKTMGLSSYGKLNSLIPPLFEENRSNPDLFYETLDSHNNRKVKNNFNFISPHKPNHLKYSQEEKDLAWKVQNDTQQIIGNYIEQTIKETGLKKVCCAGGYFLNCVANYYLTKRFPDIEFYFEPLSHDGGTAIGAAYMRQKELFPNFKPNKQKTLYYGSQYSKKDLKTGIKKYVDN